MDFPFPFLLPYFLFFFSLLLLSQPSLFPLPTSLFFLSIISFIIHYPFLFSHFLFSFWPLLPLFPCPTSSYSLLYSCLPLDYVPLHLSPFSLSPSLLKTIHTHSNHSFISLYFHFIFSYSPFFSFFFPFFLLPFRFSLWGLYPFPLILPSINFCILIQCLIFILAPSPLLSGNLRVRNSNERERE